MSGPPPQWDIGEFPEWARTALKNSLDAVQGTHPLRPDRGQSSWPLLLDAAVVAGFLPRELAPDTLSGESRSAAEKSVLRFAETMHDTKGTRWSLTRENRAAVLTEALGTHELEEALERTAKQFDDPVSRALDRCLSEKADQGLPSDMPTLEATRTAVSWLSELKDLNLPPLDELDREIELRRLLAPFERMTGQELGPDAASRTVRFFGRVKELEQLRDYVGVLPSSSLAGAFGRAFRRVTQTLNGRAPLVVWGTGGVGKTTLVSSFMLEHARAARSHYPFAYLDFDRTTVAARQRVALFGEMCMQVGAQFVELRQRMLNLQMRASEFGSGTAETSDADSISRLLPYIREFRSLIDGHMQSLESRFEWARPFLLVFDTFEVVQFSPEDVFRLEQFVAAFANPQDDGMWPRMRLIISGRQQVSEFQNRETESLRLDALDAAASAEMLTTFAADAGKKISLQDARDLVASIAKATGKTRGGAHPLWLRLIGEMFYRHTEDGPTLVRALRAELDNPLYADGVAGKILVNGVLVRRVLGHVTDPRVRALADPGLVVRRITPEVIQNVMTVGSERPGTSEDDPVVLDSDIETIREPWIVDEAEATDIFEAFGREVSLVEPDGNALRHRPDVRREMLPLIRARRPNRFHALNALAFKYFRSLFDRNPTELVAASEAIYHGLWLERPITELSDLWPTQEGFSPRIDAEEFPQSSDANIFIRAKNGSPLENSDLKRLPAEMAMDWIAARAQALLTRQGLKPIDVDTIREATQQYFEAFDRRADCASPVARLLYRSGLWTDARELLDRHFSRNQPLPSDSSDTELSLARTYMTLAAKAGALRKIVEQIANSARTLRDPLMKVELSTHAFMWFAGDGHVGPEARSMLDGSADHVPNERWQRDLRILRLAILTGATASRQLMVLCLRSLDRLSPEPELLQNAGDIDLLAYAGNRNEFDLAVEQLRSGNQARGLEMLDGAWRKAKPMILRAVEHENAPTSGVLRLLAFEHSDWIRCLGNSLTRALRGHGAQELKSWLIESGFADRGGRRTSRLVDGLEVVRSMFDQGRLLEFARTLSERHHSFSELQSLSIGESGSYPDDVYGLAGSLLRWHTAILKVITPSRYLGDIMPADQPVLSALQPVHDYPDDPKQPSDGIALCLSGGGYRAMLFHLGALWRLNELQYLPKLSRVSSVSGGSITSGALALNWKNLGFDANGFALNFDKQLTQPIRGMASQSIDISSLVAGILGGVSKHVQDHYNKYLYNHAKLQDIADAPRFVFNATSLQTGVLWRFSKPFMGDYKVGLVKKPDVELATAVAASSAFPPVLAPCVLHLDPNSFDPNLQPPPAIKNPDFLKKIVLADGGVYDNLGLETAWKQNKTVMVSDGGGLLSAEADPAEDWLGMTNRVLSVIYNQVGALRKRAVIEFFSSQLRDGSYWGIGTDIRNYNLPTALVCPIDVTTKLAQIPTRLTALDSTLQEQLIDWGYAVCDAAMRRWVVANAPAPAQSPYGTFKKS